MDKKMEKQKKVCNFFGLLFLIGGVMVYLLHRDKKSLQERIEEFKAWARRILVTNKET